MIKLVQYISVHILFLTLTVTLGMVSLTSASEPEAIILRTAITPNSEIWIGQRVTLKIDVLGRDGWAQIKDMSAIEIPGAYLVSLESQGTRLSEEIGGYEYSGQRYQLSIFPQQSGVLTVPSIPVMVAVSKWGAESTRSFFSMETPALSFEVQMVPGAEGIDGIISTSKLEARQQWNSNEENFKTGDAIKRTIQITASDLPGMAFLPISFPDIKNVGVYVDEPAVDDQYSRGSLTGMRSETVTYVFEQEGSFELPEINIYWWDISKKTLEKIILQGRSINSTDGPSANNSSVGESNSISSTLVAVFIATCFLILLWIFRKRVTAKYRVWQERREQSEKVAFQSILKACQDNNAKETYKQLQNWLTALQGDLEPVSLQSFLTHADNPKLTQAVTVLEDALFKTGSSDDSSSSWSGRDISTELKKSKKKLTLLRSAEKTTRSSLAPLNPS